MTDPLESVSVDDLFESARHATEKHNQELRAKARTKEELTIGLECVVEEVNCYQGSTSFTPRSEMMIGGSSPSYGGGHTYQIEIKVNSKTLVEKLEFNGWPHLEAGDTVRAYILKGQTEYEKSFEIDLHHNPPSHWIGREYKPTEHPSKIEKLRDGKVVATYHNC